MQVAEVIRRQRDAALGANSLVELERLVIAFERFFGLVLQVNDEIQPGVVLVPGQRPTSETVSGTINMLCSDRYTDMGQGATYQSTWLDVGAWKAA